MAAGKKTKLEGRRGHEEGGQTKREGRMSTKQEKQRLRHERWVGSW